MSNKPKLRPPKRLEPVAGVPVGLLMRVCRNCGTDEMWVGWSRDGGVTQYCARCEVVYWVEVCHEPGCEAAS
jgi:hypothetical protein